jgi:hypothetical protein
LRFLSYIIKTGLKLFYFSSCSFRSDRNQLLQKYLSNDILMPPVCGCHPSTGCPNNI